VGKKGMGKTLLLTWLLFYFSRNNNQKIIANYTLYGIEYDFMQNIPKSPNDFLDALVDKVCGFDELHLWLDSRCAMTKANTYTTNILSLSRHAKTHFFYTTQDMEKVDKRVRRETNYIITIKSIIKLNGLPAMIHYKITDMETFKQTTGIADVRKIINYYDTHEILRLPEVETNDFAYSVKRRGRPRLTESAKEENGLV
jgi:hypothetical protein